MSLPNEDATVTHRSLTAYYGVALAIVASMLLLAFLTLAWQLGKNQGDASLINISGRQRMLSQRIPLLASSLVNAGPDQNTGEIRDDLLDAVDLMQESQDWLTGAVNGQASPGRPMSSSLQKLYFGDDGVESLVRAHIADASRLATITELNHTTPEAKSLANTIRQRAISPGLLEKLDRIVEQYESEAELKLQRFWWLEFSFLLIGLCALAAEVKFIFRPMVQSVIKNVSELQSANRELLEFAYRISHDLRAPILSSIGIVAITKDALNENDVEEAKESLNHIGRALNRVSKTSEDIVQLTKLRMAEVNAETFRLSQVIEESLAAVSHMSGYANVAIQIDRLHGDLIHTKRTFVNHSIENLLSNAIKYQDSNKDRPSIKIEATVENETCIVSVTDNGLGIAAEYQPRIFSMFQRFHPKVSFGSGLGLYLVKQNASALEGEVIYSPCEKGSRFTLSFPVQEGTIAN
ncbi:Phytochrome-like protein cph1 [Roseimaritima multifibrata]|uniref:histidine kinase n=1 Tax=Roseimaritima multifibrata TaxID=1930274 RepID=A0A517MHA6_9BACT|nr:ATP-binding protein [Roseimaritima multifibrata]QDS94265.1 Phytochrome-like protein cph1 [Roseimaritima multifibrata]